MKRATEREEQAIRKGDFIHEGVFKYPARLEELRWQRTREIIRRVVPGMDEDPTYLEMLSRQAAAIEIVLCKQHIGSPDPKVSAMCDSILIGTTVDLEPLAFKDRAGEDHFVVLLSYGFISFLYQVAKAVVLSWRRVKAPPGKSVSFSLTPDDINSVIDKDPYPLELLYKTIHTYIFKGYPRAIAYDPPPAEYQPPLSYLTNLLERFVVAHEYGHAFQDQLHSLDVLPTNKGSWQKEFAADSFAFFITAISAGALDLIPANIALQGGFFSLSGFDVLRKALDIVSYGMVQKDVGVQTHPPTQQRMEVLKELYRDHVSTNVKKLEGALGPSETLNLLWDRIQHRFLEEGKQGSKPHPMWGRDLSKLSTSS